MIRDQERGGGPASTVMAGFIVWLAGRRVPALRRQGVHREVERFLAWQHAEFGAETAELRPAVWCYLLRLQRAGEGEPAVLRAWGALELLLDYAETEHAVTH
jgi:hypothetical protein